MERIRSPGWYPDPVRVGRARFWDGSTWTQTVSWGGHVSQDATPLPVVMRNEEKHDADVIERYVTIAEDEGLLDHQTAERLHGDVGRRLHVTRVAPPAPLPRPALKTPIRQIYAPPARLTRPPDGRPVEPAPVPVPREQGLLIRWWARGREALASDLGLHGLAYLGVLLLFTGVFGLIAFSFDEVRRDLRVWAELLVPLSFFMSAWYLRRRGADVVAAALTVLGGVPLPLVAIASVTDGAAVPPDLTGSALPLVQALICVVISVGMALVVRRTPRTPLRFVAPPVLWLGVGVAAGALNEVVPVGQDILRPEPLQFAAVLLAVMLHVSVIRLRRLTGAYSTAALQSAPYVAGAAYLLELLVAGNTGWAAWSGVVSAVAVVLLLELLADRFPPDVVTVGQIVAIGVAGLRFAPSAALAWVGCVVALLLIALAEWSGWRRPTAVGAGAVLIAIAAALALTIDEPAVALLAFGLATVWTLVRRAVPANWAPAEDPYGLVPAALSTVLAAELWSLLAGSSTTIVVYAAVIISIAVAGRVIPQLRADLLWRWWVPSAAIVTTLVGLDRQWGEASLQLAVASSMSAVAIALSVVPVRARAWLTAAVASWALANAGEYAGIPLATQALLLALLAFAMVIAGVVADGPVLVQLGLIGHLGGVAATAVPVGAGWAITGVVGLATAGWLVAAVVHERRGVSYLVWIRVAMESATGQAHAWIDSVPPFAVLAGTSTLAVLALDAAGLVDPASAWGAVSTAAVAAGAAVIVRLTPWRRADRRALSAAVFALVVASALATVGLENAAGPGWPTIATLFCGVAVVLIHRTPRPVLYGWVGWAESGALTVLLAEQWGIDPRWLDVVVAGWGSVVLVGTVLLYRVRAVPTGSGTILDVEAMRAPVLLGSAALASGGAASLVGVPATTAGWLCVGLAVPVLTVALLLSLGSLGGLAESLLSAAFTLLAPWSPLEHPWSLVPWAAGLLLLAWRLRARTVGERWVRWDVPTFLVAHGVAVLALVAALEYGSVPATFVSVAVLSSAVGHVLSRPGWTIVGAALALVGAGAAGSGWLALTLALEGVAATAAGLRLDGGSVRRTLLVVGSAMIAGAWVFVTDWQAWSTTTVLVSTSLGAALLSLPFAWAVRRWSRPDDLWRVWLVASAVVAVTACGLVVEPEVGQRVGWLSVAGALVVLSIAAGLSAAAIHAALRWVAAGLLVGSSLATLHALEPVSVVVVVVAGTLLALVIGLMMLLLHAARPASPWIGPGVAVAAFAQLAALLVAVDQLPRRDLLIAVLLACGAESAVAGAVLRATPFAVAAPIFACGAWLLYASDSLVDANWFTVPIGFTILVDVGLIRWLRRARGQDVASTDLVMLELVGMFFMVAASIAQVLAGHLWYSLLAIVIGVALGIWGITTRVRRRAIFGAATVGVAVLLLLGVPLAGVIPAWRGPALWIAIAALGLAAIVVATLIEQGRSAIRNAATRLDEMTADWE